MFKILFPRGGLGNRLRFIESALMKTNKRCIILWAVNSECHIDFNYAFEIRRSSALVRVVNVGRLSGLLLNILNYVFSHVFKKYFSRDERMLREEAFFISSPHSFNNNVDRFKVVWFSSGVSKEIMQTITEDYAVFYLRGTDNVRSITSTNFQELIKVLESGKSLFKCIGMSDDLGMRYILSSFGANITRQSTSDRKSTSGMMEAIEDLYVMSRATEIHCSNYSSFAELAYAMSESTRLIKYEINGKTILE